jgi:hypothetical protein
MTPQDLDRLDALAAKATDGPWEADGPIGGHYHYTVCAVDVGTVCDVVCDCDDPVNGGRDNHDAAYIAACDPSTVRALIAEVRRLRRGVAESAERAAKALGTPLGRDPGYREWCANCLNYANNLLAGREWDNNGTTAAMPRKGNEDGV